MQDYRILLMWHVLSRGCFCWLRGAGGAVMVHDELHKPVLRVAIVAIDQGTTGTTCVLYGPGGEVLARSYREISQIYPSEGWVEHDPEEIWNSVLETVGDVLRQCPAEVSSVGITNQRETVVVWDRRSGRPVCNAVVWQCRRTAELCGRYREHEELIASRTGLPLDAYFSATKIRWILDHVPVDDEQSLLFGTVDSWLLWKLTGGRVHATDFTNASRTLLYNIVEKRWDGELLELFGIAPSLLPEVKNSMDDFGRVSTPASLSGVPVTAVAGDQQAALFGQCCFERGSMKNTYGTGCFMVMNTGEEFIRSGNGLVTTLAIGAGGEPCYALEGSVFIGGAAIQWLRDELRLIGTAGESEEIARRLPSNGGVYLVPAFAGLGAPHWNMDVRGSIVGLTRGTGRDHLVRAALESIAYQSCDVFQAMVADTAISPDVLVVDGGAAANRFLMQFQSDMLGVPVQKPRNLESTSLGAAFLAGLKAGVWSSARELEHVQQAGERFEPDPAAEEYRARCLAGWRHAVRQTLAE